MEIDQEKLIETFQELLNTEKTARDWYNRFLMGSPTEHEKEIISKIRDDEIRHMEIAQKIIDLIKEEQ